MSRVLVPLASFALVVVIQAVGACAGTGDGTGDGDGRVPCDSPLDCQLGESCRDGVCTDGSSEGEGESVEGEGEGEGTQDEIITAVCQRFASCQGQPVEQCINDLTFQIDDMRARGTEVCFQAAEATLEFFACLNGLTCAQVQNDPFGFCPNGQTANNLQSQCFNSGEGEGEGECSSNADCPVDTFCFDGRCVRDG